MNSLLTAVVRGLRILTAGLKFSLRKPREALLLARMAACVLLLSLAARALPLPRIMGLMRPIRPRPRVENHAQVMVMAEVAGLLDLLLALDFFVFEPICWKRAPVLYRFLALRGVETRVMFGLRKDEAGGFEGHAWLEAEGRPVLEAGPPQYRVTYSYPPARVAVPVETLGGGAWQG